MIGVDLLEVADAFVAIEMVRSGVERGVRAARREHAVRDVAAELEREDARRVGGKRHCLQIEHQLDVLLERIGHADRRAGQLARLAALVRLLHLLDAALDLADVVQVIRQARAIGGAQLAAQIANRLGDEIEDALIVLAPRPPRFGGGPDAEQLIEHRARIADHRQRIGRRRPADGVRVDARVVVGAAAGLIDVLDAELHRRNRRQLAELLRVDLVERRAREHVRALRLFRLRLRQEHRRRAEVIGADFRRRERFGVADVGVADNRQVITIRLERLEAGRTEVEVRSRRGRRPHVLLDAEGRATRRAVNHFHGDQPQRPSALGERARGQHRIEERQRDRGADALERSAARELSTGEKHSLLLAGLKSRPPCFVGHDLAL